MLREIRDQRGVEVAVQVFDKTSCRNQRGSWRTYVRDREIFCRIASLSSGPCEGGGGGSTAAATFDPFDGAAEVDAACDAGFDAGTSFASDSESDSGPGGSIDGIMWGNIIPPGCDIIDGIMWGII